MSWNNQGGGGPWRSPGPGTLGPGSGGSPAARRPRGVAAPASGAACAADLGGGGSRGSGFGARGLLSACPCRRADLVRASARSTPCSPTRSASISSSAATPARRRPASTPTGPGRSARSSRFRSGISRSPRSATAAMRGADDSRRKPDADRRPEHRQRAFSRDLADRPRPSRGLRLQHPQSRARRSKRSPRASCARSSA